MVKQVTHSSLNISLFDKLYVFYKVNNTVEITDHKLTAEVYFAA